MPVFRIVLLAAVYFAAGKMGLLLPIVQGNITLLWAPSGIALAAVLMFGPYVWPGIALGAFLVNWSTGAPLATCLGITAGNTLEALVSGGLLLRAGFDPALRRTRDVLALLSLGAAVGPLLGASFGVSSLALTGLLPAEKTFMAGVYWWLGDAVGILLVTPLWLTWRTLPRRPWPRERALEAVALGVCLVVASALMLVFWIGSGIPHPPLSSVLFPFLAWAALRFGPRGAAAATLAAMAIALWATVNGRTPFIQGTMEERLIYLHSYMAIAAVTSLLLAAIFAERRRAEDEIRASEERLRLALTEAEGASEAKDRFLAALSHELRTPLTPVLAVVSRLERDGRLRAAADDLAMIRRNVELESRLIDDLLDLTRIGRGKLDLQREVTDARAVLEHALRICCEPAISSGLLRVETRFAAIDHRVWADPPRLMQIFWNLLNNAVKFTPEGGVLRVSTRREGPWLEVEVADSGIGIEPDLLPRIFNAFEQGSDSASSRPKGLGLGLAISQAIAGMHGGELAAASDGPGRGASFTIRVPAGIPAGAKAPRSEAPDPGSEAQNPKSFSILLVEDHADTAEAMAELLRLLGHRVSVAGGVAAAREAAEAALRDGGLDLVISDLGLPDGSGLDVMRELGGRHQLPGIALSGYGMEEDVRKSCEAGFDQHLTKPVSLQALENAIRRTMRRETSDVD